MRTLSRSPLRIAVLRPGLFGAVLLLAGCQIVAPQSVPAPRLPADAAGVSVAGVTAAPSASTAAASTYTIKRDTLHDSLSLSGKVVPGRSALLVFHGSGTVTIVNVTQGQTVQAGDDLAEFSPDDASLQAARAQATLADLAYQSEQAKLDALKSGTNTDSVQQLGIIIERDQAEIQKLQQEKVTAQAASDHAAQMQAAAQATADRKVGLAQVAAQSANDGLATAQANLKHAQEDAQAAQDQTRADAESAATAASTAVRGAQALVDDATAKLAQAKSGVAASRVTRQLETQQLRVDQDKDMLADAQAGVDASNGQTPSADNTAHQIAASIASANATLRTAQRTLATDSLELKHLQADLAGAKAADASDVKTATAALDISKQQLATLQAAEQQAQQKAQTLAKQSSIPPSRATQQSLDAAQTAVKQAEAAVSTATYNLEDAQAAQDSPVVNTPVQFDEHALTAANLQLNVDQAKLKVLQAGTSAIEIANEQTRVDLLRDQANATAAAAQPVVVLKAPFAGTVAELGVSPGQILAPGASGSDGVTSNSQTSAIRLVAAGANSILADAGEADVAQLSRGQSVDLTFPGVPNQTASGTVADIGATAVVKDNQVTYPVRIDLPSMPASLRFGMTAQAQVNLADAQNVLVAPARAIRTANGQDTVSKIDANGQVRDVPVTIGRTYGSNVEVLSGVVEGDVISLTQTVAGVPNQP